MARQNAFVELPDSDQVIVGGGVSPESPTIVEFYGNLGVDFAFLDLEHAGFSPWDAPRLEEFTARADLADIDLLVRLPSGEAEAHQPLVRKVLDTGVRNILVPRIETADEVYSAIEASQFYYDNDLGERGIGGGRSTVYGGGFSSTYVEDEDRAISVGVMIENQRAIDNLDEILAVPELGFAFIGNMDLSHSLGHPTELGHPDVQDTIAEIEEAFQDSSVPLGAMFFDPENTRETVDRGYQLLMGGHPLAATADHFDSVLGTVDDQLDEYSR